MENIGLEPMNSPDENRDALPTEGREPQKTEQKKPRQLPRLSNSDLDGTRTHDSLIKSQVLYRLSYEIETYKIKALQKAGAKINPPPGKFQPMLKIFPTKIWNCLR